MKKLFVVLALTLALAGCARPPQPAERVKIKSVWSCENESGITMCTVSLDNGKVGKVEKYFAVEGSPIREDMVK